MIVHYLDFSGNRQWEKVIDSQNLLENVDNIPQKGDLVFIHSTDFVPSDQIALDKRFKPKGAYYRHKKSLETIISMWEENGKIGDGWNDILVISGGTILSDTQEKIRDTLFDHKQEIYFRDKPVDQKSDLNSQFGEFLKQYRKKPIRPSSFFNKNKHELLVAFKILLQAYVVAMTNDEDLPDPLKIIKQKITDVTFGIDYWSPVLVDKKIAPELSTFSDNKLGKVLQLLINHDFENNIPEKCLRLYRDIWFNDLKTDGKKEDVNA